MQDELHQEYAILKLLREDHIYNTQKENSLEVTFRPPDLVRYHQNRVKNPEGYNKLLAFAIKNIHIHDYTTNKKIHPNEKIAQLATVTRLEKELFRTPYIETFTDESRDKAYRELRNVGVYKTVKQEKDIKDLKESLKIGMRNEVHTILGAFQGRQEVAKDEMLKEDIHEFLDKFKDLK